MRGKKAQILYASAFLAVFLLALCVRAYRLGELPYGWNVDEAGMAYDMYSLVHYGTDRYYKFAPVYFINFGGGQNALYGYICAFFIKYLGLKLSVIRIPAVLSGMTTWLFGTLILRECFEKKFVLLGSFLIAVMPCFILQSRIGLESLLFLSASTVAIYLTVLAVKRGKCWLYALAGAAFGVTLYSYAVSYLVIPLFLAVLFLYLWHLKKLKFQYVLSLGIPLAILATPLILMIIINTFDLPEIATAYITIPRLLDYRGSEVDWQNILHNIPVLLKVYFLKDEWAYNSLDNYFNMYVISVPLILLGTCKAAWRAASSVRKREFSEAVPLLIWLAAQTVMGLLIQDPNINKMNGVYFALLFFAVWGIRCIYEWFRSAKGRRLWLGATAGIYACFFAAFAQYYFGAYTEDTFPLPNFADCYDDILDEYQDVIGENNVYVDANYIYYALGERLAPQEFQLIEKGMESRGNVYFSTAEVVDENGFYILRKREEVVEKLQEMGFTAEQKGFYTVVYKAAEEG